MIEAIDSPSRVANAVAVLPDGNIIVAGYTESFGAGRRDVYVLKLSPYGKKIWEKTYGGRDWDEAHAVAVLPDGNIIVAGRAGASSFNTGKMVAYFLKLRASEQVAYKKPSTKTFHFPPDLGISDVKFYEPSGNKALDAFENGKISFLIENKGKGDAHGVYIRTVKLQGEGEIEYPKKIVIGNIPPHSTKKVSIPLKAKDKTKDETVKLRIETHEQLGFNAAPFTISFETTKFNPPIFDIASVAIDDDEEGDSYGNNDGIIQPGEQIELTLAIQNKGLGDAKKTRVKIMLPDEGNNLYYTSKSHIFNLGTVGAGDYKNIKFAFAVAKTYKKQNILIRTKIDESTGKGTKTDSVVLPVGKPTGYGKEITVLAIHQNKKVHLKKITSGIDIEKPIKYFGKKRENGLCVIIGIEKYKKAPKSLYSNRDAMTFYDYAKNVLGIEEKNIYIITNEDATVGEFDKIFGEDGWLARRVNKESEIFVYFSGHGVLDYRTGEQYLLAYDVDPNYPQVAYSLKKLYNNLSKLGAKSTVIFLDACFTGESREGKLILASARPLSVKKIEKPLEHITLFTATGGSETASGYDEKKHGLFTYYLLQGLRKNADLNRDNVITAQELYNYVKERVEKKAIEMDREQHPQLLGNNNIKIVEFK